MVFMSNFFFFPGEVYVLATSKLMEIIYILKLRGYNGFEVIQEIPAPGVIETRVFTVGSHLYLALNSRTFPSRVLKASVQGAKYKFPEMLLLPRDFIEEK